MKTSWMVRIGMVLVAVLLTFGMVTSIHAASLSGSALQQKKSTPATPATPGQSSPSIAQPPSSTAAGAGGMKKEMMKKVGNIIVDSTTAEYGKAYIQAKLVDLAGMPIRNVAICEGKKIVWTYYEQQEQGGGLGGSKFGNFGPQQQSYYGTLSNCEVTDSGGRAMIHVRMAESNSWTPGNHAVYVIYNPPQSKEYAIGKGNILITKAKLQFDFSDPRNLTFKFRGDRTFLICGHVNGKVGDTILPVEMTWSPGSPAGPVNTVIKQDGGADACFEWTLPGGTVLGQPRQFQFTLKYSGSEYYLPATATFNIPEHYFTSRMLRQGK